MSFLSNIFNNNKAFIGYLTAGDGGMDYCRDAFLALASAGVNALEIGMPFTDPVADGPIIQAAMRRSLQWGTTPEMVLSLGNEIRKKSATPLVLFTYYNPLFKAGPNYLNRLADAGFNGVLVNDIPIEEIHSHLLAMSKAQLDPILITTPATPADRLEKITSHSKGFIYYACQKGTTGLRKHLPDDFEKNIRSIKDVTKTPVAAGFGISSQTTAAEVLKYADGFVIGSAFVQLAAKKALPEEFIELANALDPRAN